MSISVGQVKGNPEEAVELIGVLEAENERLRDLARRMVDEFEYSSDRSDGTLSQGRRDLLDEARAIYQQSAKPEK